MAKVSFLRNTNLKKLSRLLVLKLQPRNRKHSSVRWPAKQYSSRGYCWNCQAELEKCCWAELELWATRHWKEGHPGRLLRNWHCHPVDGGSFVTKVGPGAAGEAATARWSFSELCRHFPRWSAVPTAARSPAAPCPSRLRTTNLQAPQIYYSLFLCSLRTK